MFVERRQRVTGIDKSYPLQPISKSSPVNSTRQKMSQVGYLCFHNNYVQRNTYYMDGYVIESVLRAHATTVIPTDFQLIMQTIFLTFRQPQIH